MTVWPALRDGGGAMASVLFGLWLGTTLSLSVVDCAIFAVLLLLLLAACRWGYFILTNRLKNREHYT